MKALLFAIVLFPTVGFSATNFNFYASPLGYYQCYGYNTGICVGFESSDPTLSVDRVMLRVNSEKPLVLGVEVWGIGGDHFYGASSENGAQFTLADRGAGNVITMSVNWFRTKHCVTTNGHQHCAVRYLPESGTVSVP